MSQPPPETAVDPLDEELIAYLDSELNDDARTVVEQRLASDETYRQRLKLLQQAWDMLDMLPSSVPSDSFTRTTVAMTIDTAQEQAETQLFQAKRKQNNRVRLGVAAVGMAVAVGYFIVMARIDAPNRQLLRDLPVIEHVDEYRVVDDLDFLRQLAEEGLFVEVTEVSDESY